MRIHKSILGLLIAVGFASGAQAQSSNLWSLSMYTGGNVGRTTEMFTGSATGTVYGRGNVYAGPFNVGGGIFAGSEVIYSGAVNGGISAGYNVTLNGGSVSGGVNSGGSLKSTLGSTAVSGGVRLAGTNQAGAQVTISGGTMTGATYVAPVNFVTMENAFRSASSLAASLSPTGVAIFSGNMMTLNASGSGTNVFSLTAAQIAGAQNVVINAAAGSTVLINVSGGSVALNAANWSFAGGASASKTMINAAGAWDVTAVGTVSATLLAPDALVRFTNATVHGSVIALGAQGSANFDGGFTGVIPAPGAWAILGCCGVFVMRRARVA